MKSISRVSVIISITMGIVLSIGVFVYMLTIRDVGAYKASGTIGDLDFVNQVAEKTQRDIFNVLEKTEQKKNKVLPSKPIIENIAAEKKQEQPSNIIPSIGYTYVGYLERQGKGEAFVMKGDDMYVVMVGDSLTSRYRVISITKEQMKLRYEPQGQIIVLLMSGRAE